MGRRGGAVISLVSGLLQNTLGQFWLSLILGEEKKIIFCFYFFLKKKLKHSHEGGENVLSIQP